MVWIVSAFTCYARVNALEWRRDAMADRSLIEHPGRTVQRENAEKTRLIARAIVSESSDIC
jgi:hypothetical protein